jgi:hypothetical protein
MSNKNNWFDKTNHLELIIDDYITSLTNKVRIILLEK